MKNTGNPKKGKKTDLFAELVGKCDQHPPVAFPLVRGKGKDARQVVPEVGVLLLAEVSHGVKAEGVHLQPSTERKKPNN